MRRPWPLARLAPSAWRGFLRSWLIYYGQPWKLRRMQRLYAPYIGPGDLCFDIGAHLGNRTWVWRQLGATVVALEPQPALARWLTAHTADDAHVTVVPAAAGDAPGHATLRHSARTPTVSTLSADWIAAVRRDQSFQHVHWNQAVQVPVTTLDALIAQFGVPAFCKIDVEGYEAAVLRGLSQPLPALSFEYIPAARAVAAACVDRLAALGAYRFAATTGERQTLGRWTDADSMRAWLTSLPDGAPSGDIFAINQ